MNDVAGSPLSTAEYTHSFRRNAFSSQLNYRLLPEGLECSAGKAVWLIPYRDVMAVDEYRSKVRGALSARLPRRFDYVLHCRDGRKVALDSVHWVRFGVAEDRSSSCATFIAELKSRIVAANPAAQFVDRLAWSHRIDIAANWIWYRIGLLLWTSIRRIDFDKAANFIAGTLRTIGPWLRGHRTARANLVAAYPEKSTAQIEQILTGMWENLGRLGVEYVNLDRLVDPASPNTGRIVVAPGTLETLARLRDDGKPAVLFTSHQASYEVGAIWVEHNGLDLAILYNPSNFGPLSERLQAMQKASMGRLIPSGPDSVWKIKEAMKSGSHLALFADQHFFRGVEVTFFGRRCKVNPMAARFAQLFDCPVHGFRTIRLPDNRIEVEFTGPVELPRDRKGKIDIAAAMQKITSVVEIWAREYPEQWLWLQRRWR